MNQDQKGAGWSRYLIFVCISVTIGFVLPVGYCLGVTNAPAEFIKTWAAESFKKHYSFQLSDGQITLLWASIVSMFQIGGIIGSLCANSLNTRYGRRGTLRITEIVFAMSCLLFAMCRFIVKSVEMVLLGRLLSGIASALVIATQPMYLVEIAPPELSGSVGVFTCIGVTFGIVVGQLFSFDFVLGTQEHWHWSLAAFMIFVIFGSLVSCFYPESPRYLVANGNTEAAKKELRRLRGNSDTRTDLELAQIIAAASGAEPSMSIKDVACNAKLRMAVILVCSFHFVQQGSGINAIFLYSVDTFTTAGFSSTAALWLNFVLGALNFVVALCGIVLMAKVNRRIMMLLSCILSALFMLLLSFGLYLTDQVKWLSYLCIAFLALYIVAFNMALGPMPFFIGSELFLISPRAAVMALGSLTNWIMNFLMGMVFPILSDCIGSIAFLLFTVICIYGFLITYRYLPESRNRAPEEVAPLLENGFKSKIK